MPEGFDYVIKNGIDLRDAYPYEAKNSDKGCRFNPSKIGARISNYTELPRGDEDG